MTAQLFKLSPSDLTFLWDECPRCFYLKVKHQFPRPSAPFPSIFSKIDGLMKNHFMGKNTIDILPDLPSGKFSYSGNTVKSDLISFPGKQGQCFLSGRIDTAIEFDDGSYGIIDFKTSEPKPAHIDFYSRQLHAYAYALENPATGSFNLFPISRLGLMVVEPKSMQAFERNQIAYIGKLTWQEIPRDNQAFMHMLDKIMEVLCCPEPPMANESCGYCKYRELARKSIY